MDLINEEGKLNFVIDLHHDYKTHMSGGVIALHTLAYKIAQRGHNVYIFCKPEYPHKNIHVIPSKIISKEVLNQGYTEFFEWENFNYPIDKTVSILLQISMGNVFNTKHNSRWILYDTQFDLEKNYEPNDVYFNYGNFKTYRNVPDNKLTVVNFNFDKLYQTNFGDRKGICHITHKNTPPNGELIFEQLMSKNLNDWNTKGGFNFLREQFNKYEYFLTYDQKSFYTVAAALCGCKSIILNPGPSYELLKTAYSDSEEYENVLTPTEYRLKNPLQMFGVAYGWDDLSWANKTINLVPNYLKELEKIEDKTVDGFIKYWEKKLFDA